MDKYIYSQGDIEEAIEDVMEEVFGTKYTKLSDLIVERVKFHLDRYVNLYRFYDRNCCGCPSGNDSCDLAYDRVEGTRAKAVLGEIYDCPFRINGTLTFSQEEGLKSIDISDRDKPPYPIVVVKD